MLKGITSNPDEMNFYEAPKVKDLAPALDTIFEGLFFGVCKSKYVPPTRDAILLISTSTYRLQSM